MSSAASAVHSRPHPVWLLILFWISVVIALAAVLRRVVALVSPSRGGQSPTVDLDRVFTSHAALTMAHILVAAVFVVLAAFVMLRRQGGSPLVQQLFFLFGLLTGVTAYAMNRYPVGGWREQSAVLFFNTWFLYSLFRAYRRPYGSIQQRPWLTRAVGTVLGIATTRPVMGAFFATSARTHLTLPDFFGIAFWIGFSLNVIVTELWLHSRRRRAAPLS